MAIEDRPYVGSWRLNNQKVVRHTPDCMVFINGDTTIPGCPTCSGRIDFQKFITQVSVDPTTEPPATASLTLRIPRQQSHTMIRDGQFVIKPGLEIHIYMRGYFPVKGMTQDVTPSMTGGLDITEAVMHPYYHVFHGVVTETSHEYSGGEHTASISAADLLHFWQYQRIATSGSYLGKRPDNSRVRMTLVGHNLTGMTPYAIIYTMFKAMLGAAGGVEFAMGNETNTSARSEAGGESLWTYAQLYWEKRFSQQMMSLRMYGVDGSLYNAYQQAFLTKLSSDQTNKLAAVSYADRTVQDKEMDPLYRRSRAVGLDPHTLYTSAEAEGDAQKGGVGINVNQMQAFVSDIGQWGQVNLFETAYATKMEIAQTVCEITGFEFYQDVDGDLVFKPPFWNLDTHTSRTYVIKPEDVVSFTVTEREPECTVVKLTGSWFKNIAGTGVEGEWGTRAEFIDFRLVAQFGWRQQAIETSYITDPRAMFYAAIARFDAYNIAVNGATCQIPIRPELRPGYPVYVEHLDCYYYLTSFNHSFSFGGQCLTTLNLVGKRAKFYAPGWVPGDRKPTVEDIDLSNAHLPRLPLEVEGNDGVPRYQGMPNVVMALDPELVNPLVFLRDVSVENVKTTADIQTLVWATKLSDNPVLETYDEGSTSNDEKDRFLNGPWILRTTDAAGHIIESPGVLVSAAGTVSAALNAASTATTDAEVEQAAALGEAMLEDANALALYALLESARSTLSKHFPEGESTAHYLELLNDLKASFNPGVSLPGYYRYYSSAHPDEIHQGQKALEVGEQGESVGFGAPPSIDAEALSGRRDPTTAPQFAKGLAEGAELAEGPVTKGLPIMQPGTTDAIPTPTHLVTMFSIARHDIEQELTWTSLALNESGLRARRAMTAGMKRSIEDGLNAFRSHFSLDTQITITRTSSIAKIVSNLEDDIARLGVDVTVTPWKKFGQTLGQFGTTVEEAIPKVAQEIAQHYAGLITRAYSLKQHELIVQHGPEEKATGDAEIAFKTLQAEWSEVRMAMTGMESAIIPLPKGKMRPVPHSTTKTRTYYTPVLPVSDNRGYEVVGTYRYGRGLSIEAGGSFQLLSEVDRFTSIDIASAEEVLEGLFDDDNPFSVAVGEFSPATQAALAESMNVSTGDMLTMAAQDGDKFEQGFRNFMANAAKDSSFKVVNAAYRLADLTNPNPNDVCACTGSSVDVLLYAYDTSNFVTVADQPEVVAQWAADQAANTMLPWQQAQEALRGQVLDTGSTGTVDAVTDLVDSYKQTAALAADPNATADAEAGVEAAVEDLLDGNTR